MTTIPLAGEVNNILLTDKKIRGWRGKKVTVKNLIIQSRRVLKAVNVRVTKIKDTKLIKDYEYMISGLYTLDKVKRPVQVIFHYKDLEDIVDFSNDKKYQRFLFVLSQTVQHEMMHHEQNQKNQGETSWEILPPGLEKRSKKRVEMAMYHAETDEIEAHAHDIAMEIRFYYGKENPKMILNTISIRRNLPSYTFYRKAYRGMNWEKIRKRLLKKTFQFLDHCEFPRVPDV
jgi:hypothetical protein